MSKSIVEEAKQSLKNKKKEAKAVKTKQIIETTKTILITILVTSIVAFIAGVKYQESATEKIHTEAKSLSQVATAEPVKK